MNPLRRRLTPRNRQPVAYACEGARTLGDVLETRAHMTPDAPAHLEKTPGAKGAEAWKTVPWHEFYRRARCVAGGLVHLGIQPGERISILGPTHARWAEIDTGGQLVGVVTIGIYPRQSAEQVRYLLSHSESRMVFVADEEELNTVLEAAQGLDDLRAIVTWTEELAEARKESDPRLMPLIGLVTEALDEEICRQQRAAVDPSEPAILIYTSGTTGPPKGAMISHDNILAMMGAQEDTVAFFEGDRLISFLPMAHATERNLSFYARINTGVAAAYASSIGSVLEELQEVRPTVFGSVPRIFEKAHARIHSEMEKKSPLIRGLFQWAVDTGKRRTRHLLAGREVPTLLEWQYRLAEKLILHKIQAIFGGRIRHCITGAAPISLDILEFFWACGLPIFEAYGMTEATVITHINRPGGVKLGTVGRVIPPLEARIAEDGEILLRGPFVFPGYFKNEEATQEALQNGWLHTGDIGTIDDEGFLRITDRKKHLIITAGGKNVAPANIERAIKSQSPLISQVHAHGDRRPYVCALIAPSPLETLEWGVTQGLLDKAQADTLSAELLANPSARSEALNQAMAQVVESEEFRGLFLEPVRAGNRQLARVERVRRFHLLDRDFSQEAGELTPTLKMKRKAIEENYRPVFNRIYDETDFAVDAEPNP